MNNTTQILKSGEISLLDMETTHKVVFGSSNNMKELQDKSVHLIITSPPYPMIEMWDEQFSEANPDIKKSLEKKDGLKAFSLMHEELDKTWKECFRVLVDGGIACINIGDATRTINGDFRLYPNHSKIIESFHRLGFSSLPLILWRKETNKPNKFMGSGMLPVGAYVTLEHEYILIFRKGSKRDFDNREKEIRRNSSFFWEERNIWFSDIWTKLKGVGQKLNHKELRDRSGAYPFELVYRLINMYSMQGDCVLDPFLGTGTTLLASMCSKRNSIGYEIDPNFKDVINERIEEVIPFCKDYNLDRLKRHLEFIKSRKETNGELKHKSNIYDFGVMTAQERDLTLHHLREVKEIKGNFEAIHAETGIKNLVLDAL